MTDLRKGDIVLVPFDFTNRSGSKWRPAVVISTERYNQETPDVLIAAITSNLNAIPHPGDCLVNDWKVAGLLRPSLLQTKIATVEAAMVGRRLGELSPADLSAFERGLRQALGLT